MHGSSPFRSTLNTSYIIGHKNAPCVRKKQKNWDGARGEASGRNNQGSFYHCSMGFERVTLPSQIRPPRITRKWCKAGPNSSDKQGEITPLVVLIITPSYPFMFGHFIGVTTPN